jgi:ABC-type multidrug transport system ATPase subunit
LITVEHLKKTFRASATLRTLLSGRLRGAAVTALDDVSLTVERGEIVGLMGENGAGKSTLLRILTGLIIPDAGKVDVDGVDALHGGTALQRKVGFIAAEERGLTPTLTPRELLDWYAALHGFARRDARARVGELIEQMGLGEHADRRLRELSTGLRRRTALARGLLGRPSVLLLDEPTRGLDPAATRHFHDLVRATKCSIVIATHDRDEARQLCARVAVLERARIVAIEAPARAVERLAGVHLA